MKFGYQIDAAGLKYTRAIHMASIASPMGERSETGKVSTTQVVVMDEKDVALGRKRQLTTATRVIRANQRALVLNLLFVLLAIVVSTSATLAVVLTRPTHTGGDDLSGGTTLLAKNGEVVATATYEEEVSLAELPSQGASSDIYAQIKRVGFDTGAGAVMGFTVSGYVWYNNTDMDLFLDAGYTLHIAEGDLHVSEGCCDLPDMSSGIAQRRRMNPVLWQVFVWAVRIYTVTHGSSHNGKQDDDKKEADGKETETEGEDGGDNGGEQGDGGTGFHDQDGNCPPGALCRLRRLLRLGGLA